MKTEPALRTFGSSASGSAVHSSRCSGASSLAASSASSSVSATMMRPFDSMEARAIASRGSVRSWRSTSSLTASASSWLTVTSTAVAMRSCSAWLSRSAATQAGFAPPSASTRISLGPAIMSIATRPKTCRLASATKALPGPTILSTRGTLCVP